MRRMALAAALAVSACGSTVEGNPQVLQVLSNPDGARCEVWRGGTLLALIDPAPDSVMVPRHADPLTVICSMAGQPPVTRMIVSRPRLGSPGEVAGGGLGGRALDSLLLRDFHYPGTVTVTLAPARQPYRLPLAH